MSRYIEYEPLMAELEREVKLADDWKTAHEIANVVKYAPSIDIVRCAECKYWRNTDAEKIPTASIACGNMHPDDFCSYGERKDKCKECWHWSEAHKRCENKGGCQFKPYGEREDE